MWPTIRLPAIPATNDNSGLVGGRLTYFINRRTPSMAAFLDKKECLFYDVADGDDIRILLRPDADE